MVNIYTWKNYLNQENRKRIFPLFLDLHYIEGKTARKFFSIEEKIEKAHVAVLPLDLGFFFQNNLMSEVERFLSLANQHNLQVWIYTAGDFGISYARKNVVVFRQGGFDSKLNEDTEIMPSFISDPYDYVVTTPFKLLEKESLPRIGFVGHADGSWLNFIKEWLIHSKRTVKKIIRQDWTDRQNFFPSGFERYRLLSRLEKEKRIICDFVYRDKYRAGAKDENSKMKTTVEFFENINDNPYTICMRGAGNFSVRFYETLIMGRIPVLVNTDCRLPLRGDVDWEEHCVLADKNNVEEKIREFHLKHNSESFKQIQSNNRKLAVEVLSREHYFIKIAEKRILK